MSGIDPKVYIAAMQERIADYRTRSAASKNNGKRRRLRKMADREYARLQGAVRIFRFPRSIAP